MRGGGAAAAGACSVRVQHAPCSLSRIMKAIRPPHNLCFFETAVISGVSVRPVHVNRALRESGLLVGGRVDLLVPEGSTSIGGQSRQCPGRGLY